MEKVSQVPVLFSQIKVNNQRISIYYRVCDYRTWDLEAVSLHMSTEKKYHRRISEDFYLNRDTV